jgi:PBP1b-binding outer membrane lipoprotein LpoB
MKTKIIWVLLISSLFLNGCTIYPAQQYGAYSNGITPMLPVPVLGFGNGGFSGYRR